MLPLYSKPQADDTKDSAAITDANSKSTKKPWITFDLKFVVLLLLVGQNAMQMLSMRYSRILISSGSAPPYLSSAAVVVSEALKVTVCLVILLCQHGRETPKLLWDEIVVNWPETIKVSVPAFVYMLQNNLLYVATSNLDAATCQITYQLKILTTAVFAVTMLGQSITRLKWASLAILLVGIVFVQLPQLTGSAAARAAAAAAGNPAVGLAAVLTACVMSGFAGVWFEKLLKTSKASIWVRNVQLGAIGGALGLIGALAKDGPAIHSAGLLQGFTPFVWGVVAQVGLGGLLVAAVVKYADNVQKGFATSLSIIVSGVVSYFLIPAFAFHPTPPWLAGSALVLLATYLYSLPNRPAAPAAPSALRPPAAGPAAAA
jgi:UDP-sugar transporter A1/2/3